MAAADLLTLLPPQQTFVDDLDMDSFFDFDQDQNQNQNQNQSQTINAFGQPNLTITTDPFSQGLDDAQIFAGPSHQYDQFRQQTGVPTGNLSQLQEQITPNTSYGYFDPGVDPTWQQPMLDNETMMQLNPAMPMQHIPSVDMPMLADPLDQNVLESIEEEPVSSVGRLWPGMHQQQAAQAAHAKALALASANVLRTPQSAGGLGPTTTSKHSHARAGSIAPSANEDDFASSAYMQSSARVKKEDDDFDDDERLLNSEEGKKLTSKERRQLRNKVSARAFRSRRKGESSAPLFQIDANTYRIHTTTRRRAQCQSARVQCSQGSQRLVERRKLPQCNTHTISHPPACARTLLCGDDQ